MRGTRLPQPPPRQNRPPHGTLKNTLRLDYGFWESKDTDDDLTDEIARKFDQGYPDFNILFEDSRAAILYQGGQRRLTAPFAQDEPLHELLTAYVSFEHPEVREFKAVVERFKQDIPSIVYTPRSITSGDNRRSSSWRSML